MPPTTRQTSRRLYQPLDRNRREIRLIEILPTYANQTIQCKLHTVTLTPETYYVCISYVWGDPSITEEIIVNGVRKSVTVNLAAALRHLKKHWVEIERESNPDVDPSKFRLWADALSINQDDPLERGHQVGLMANIYSLADMVLAWLSSDDRDVTLGFNALERILIEEASTRPYKYYWPEIDDRDRDHTFSFLFPENSGLRKNRHAQLRPDEPLAHLHQTWKLAFWSRVWIQQEVILAKRVYYISPSHRMSHNQCWLANRLVNICLRPPDGMGWLLTSIQYEGVRNLLCGSRAALNLLRAKQSFAQSSNERSILARINLHFSLNLQATDDLDYVFGLLAITQVPIEPDYTRSIREVYIEFVQRIADAVSGSADNTRSVCELLNRHAVGIRQLHDLPTWAPVFSAGDMRYDINPLRCYWPPLYEPLPPVVTSVGSLWTKAIKAQTVETVYHEPGSPGFLFRGLPSFIQDFPNVYGKATYINGRPILGELCRTLLIDGSRRQYNFKHLFVALIESGHCRREDFDPDLPTSVDSSELEAITHEWEMAAKSLLGSMLFTTTDGYIGLVGEEVFPGDVVCCLANGTSHTLLRPKDGHYLFVNNCFVMGFMGENTLEFIKSRGLEAEEIEIR